MSAVCVDCGVVDEGAVMVGIVSAASAASGPDRPQYACREHALKRRVLRLDGEELELLARQRAEVTGETVGQARTALTGGRTGPAQEGRAS